MARFCRKCGAEINEGVKFCRACGASTGMESAEPNIAGVGQSMVKTGASAASGISDAIIASADAGMSSFDLGNLGSQAAGMLAGSDITGNLGSVGEGINSAAQTILPPMQAFMDIFNRFTSGLKSIKKNPLSLIPIIGLAIVWGFLYLLRIVGVEGNPFTDLISFISYGWGGAGRTLLGALGTSLGMGTVAAAFTSIVSGGIPFFGRGLNMLMGKNNRMQGISKPEGSIAWLLTGAGAALIVNRFISGTPFITGLMAVVSAAFLSVQAFGNENGWLFCLARSITARVVPVASAQLQGGRPGAAGYKSMRIADDGAIKSLMKGWIAGFSLTAIYTMGYSVLYEAVKDYSDISPLGEVPVSIGMLLLIVGIVMVLTKVDKNPRQRSGGNRGGMQPQGNTQGRGRRV